MHVFIVYAHPSRDSFTWHAKNAFLSGLEAAGHSYTVSDLYAMDFKTDMSEAEYLREAHYRAEEAVPADVTEEQRKMNESDAIAFIYPVFWTDAPAKLVGWFDRVWTYGFAYGERTMKKLEKGIVMCVTGHSIERLTELGCLNAMETVMLEDRLCDRVKEKEMIVLDEMSREKAEARRENWDRHLKTAFRIGEGM